MFNTMTDSQLSDSLATGLLLPGTETYNDLIKDPIQAERIKKAQIVINALYVAASYNGLKLFSPHQRILI